MGRLTESYAAALPPVTAPPGAPDLESRLAALYARGSSAHPQLRLEDVVFARHLALCGAPVQENLDRVYAEDLFLVCSALARQDAAIESLRCSQTPVISRYLRRIRRVAPIMAEIEQTLWELLLVGDPAAPPRLASYSGKGHLAGFIGISVQRLALSLCRRTAAQKRALAGFRAEMLATGGDPELAMIKDRYRAGFQRAVRDAVQLLDSRERMLLRMLVIDGRTMDAIAEVYGVNQSTVSRWLDRARLKVLAEVRRLVRDEQNIAETEFESLARLVLSQIDLSLTSLLAVPS